MFKKVPQICFAKLELRISIVHILFTFHVWFCFAIKFRAIWTIKRPLAGWDITVSSVSQTNNEAYDLFIGRGPFRRIPRTSVSIGPKHN